ncbi:hypothetical protein [Chondrinema litorale]|uniref:hypothetical protein n=1 Tax=Chondrinema litorale TaxID=2994555 RepID=UPI002543A9EE|nr:hypothetical protein [Chondrinema litorale]UZR93827.1 hypothetical protein OQ292_18430 [Chondrinema litorale]
MIALGNNDINTGGYAPGFVEDWLNKRIEENKIQSDTSIGLHFTPEFEKQILSELAKYQ